MISAIHAAGSTRYPGSGPLLHGPNRRFEILSGAVRFEAHQEAVMTIEVEDSVAPWNAGRWRLSVNQEGKAELSELPTDQGEQADLTTDIQTLSALFTGYKRPQAPHAIHRLSGNPKALTQLETMIPAGQTYLMDFF